MPNGEHLNVYFFPDSLFLFLPVTGNTREVQLKRSDASLALSTYPYRYVVPKPIFQTRFSGFHYFYFTTSHFISVVPRGYKIAQCLWSSGSSYCLFSTFLKSYHLSRTPPMTNVFHMDSLLTFNVSDVKYVTNSLSEFHLSNFSDLESAVQDSLPAYLSPIVHYQSLLALVVLIILIVIPLCCCVRRALTLYNHLTALQAAPARDSSVTWLGTCL